MAVNPQYNQEEQSSLEESPSYVSMEFNNGAKDLAIGAELSLLAEALSLTYPSNPKQINKASLVLTYLMGKGMPPLLAYIDNSPAEHFYLDSFAKEIFLLRFSETISVYKKSEPISVPVINNSNGVSKTDSTFVGRQVAGKEVLVRDYKKGDTLVTEEIQYGLGSDPRKDIIE